MSKVTMFRNIRNGFAFTPATPDPGANRVYVKRENGICPLLDKNNKAEQDNIKHGLCRVVYQEEAVFHPLDRVYPVNVPGMILYHYR